MMKRKYIRCYDVYFNKGELREAIRDYKKNIVEYGKEIYRLESFIEEDEILIKKFEKELANWDKK